MRLLLIDDEVRKSQALVNYFRFVYEWTVEVAQSPDRALELLRADNGGSYDVIMLDVMMDPGSEIPHEVTNAGRDTGLILLEMIVRLIPPRVRIIVYSARTDLDYLKGDERIAAYIQKPRSAREIAREIERVVSIQVP